MIESQFKDFFEHGIVASIRIVGSPCLTVSRSNTVFCVAIEFTLSDGARGLIMTKRQVNKVYRLDTAFSFLKKIGVKQVYVDVASFVDTVQGNLI